MLHRVALVRTDVSEELSVSFIRVTRIGELGTTLAVTSNQYTLRRNTTTSQKTSFFIVTAMKTSNLTYIQMFSYPVIFILDIFLGTNDMPPQHYL
jgi:hypothetical protein